MDRVSQLRGAAGSSQDSTLDTTAPPSEAFMTANESSKYFSLSEVDSTFDISSMKDDSLASTAAGSESNIANTEELISNLSPIGKKSDILDAYKIGKQIEAENILSGGVDIFEDNDNSYDGDELVIDDNVIEDKSEKQEIQGDELEPLIHAEAGIGSKDSEVVLQIDGKNVDAIDIGNGLYLYRKEGQEELAAVQIIDDDQQQTSFKFLKVRENAEGNLEVYEEFEIEVPAKQAKAADKSSPSNVPIKEIDVDKVVDRINKSPKKETTSTIIEEVPEETKDEPSEKTDPNFNAKMKFSESRKSPVIGSFTPMTFHSTPNKEGKPLTKTMVDQQLHPSRHSDNKKTIEVHTEIKQKSSDTIKKDNPDNKVDEKDVILDEKLEVPEDNLDQTEHEKPNLVYEIKDIPEEKPLKVIESSEKDENEAQVSTLSAQDNEVFVQNVKNDDNGSLSIVEQCEKKIPEKSEILREVVNSIDTQAKSDKTEQAVVQPIVVIDDKNKNKEDKLEVSEEKTATEDNIEISNQNLVIGESVNKQSEENIESEAAVISIADDSLNKDNLDTKSVEINLDDKDDAKIEEGILIIDEDNAEGTVVTIDDIINNTQSINNEVKSKNILSTNQLNENIQICVQGSEKSNVTLHEVVNTKENVTNAPADSTQEKDIEKTTSVVDKINKVAIPENTNKLNVVSSENITDLQESKKGDVKIVDTEVKDITKVEDNKKMPDAPVVPVTVTNQITLPPPKVAIVKSAEIKTKSSAVESKFIPSKKSVTNIPIVNNKESAFPKSEASIKLQPKEIAIDKTNISKVVENKQKLKIEKTSQIQPDTTTVTDSKNQTIKTKHEPNERNVVKVEPRAINHINAAVPFGQWTEANRQEFLNKFKSKVPVTTSSSSQLKNSNDLNRRDVLKKIDSQRQTSNALSKSQETNKSTKNEPAFSSKASKEIASEIKVTTKTERVEIKPKVPSKPIISKTAPKPDTAVKSKSEPVAATISSANKKESAQRTEVTMTDLIDKTVEDMIHNMIVMQPNKASQDEPKHNTQKDIKVSQTSKPQEIVKLPNQSTTLDAIEMKMNELHGIPFIERPPHELPKVVKNEVKTKSEKSKPAPAESVSNKTTKIPNLLPFVNKALSKNLNDQVIEVDSEEEVIEHPPVTGDINLNKKIQSSKSLVTDKFTSNTIKTPVPDPKSDSIITEKDFDKFARRNSITYENCLTVNFDGKEQHNVVQSVVERDPVPKTYSKNNISRSEVKPKLAYNKQQNVYPISQQTKYQPVQKYGSKTEDTNRNQSKLKKAYQSVLTAKLQKESPITIIEDKPVKVVFMDNVEYVPCQLNAQGKELSPAKKPIPESEVIVNTCDSIDTDMLDDIKSQDEIKTKNKHQRKQVLTPVEEPELELIQPKDLESDTSPKKKRKVDEDKTDKNLKYPVRKKFFQYTAPNEVQITAPNVPQSPIKEPIHRNDDPIPLKNPVSAIDSLVKAAELLENQTEKSEKSLTPSQSESPQTTPVKRGRGRPRKYPLPEGAADKKVPSPSPQKKPRLIDAKPRKHDSSSDEDDSDDAMIKENWTMGKINENIVCPICNKLFRTENVVFKHVKHCTGPSPNRSESDKRSPRRMRQSQESESKSSDGKSDDMDLEDDEPLIKSATPKKRKSNDSTTKSEGRDDVIVIEDTPDKDKIEKTNDKKQDRSRKLKPKTQIKNTDLVCEFCGKTFRQLSYLVSHKLQHKKDEAKKVENDNQAADKSVFCCEVCKKEFRKLHHLVQHRIIHNPASVPNRSHRRSSEKPDNNTDKQLSSKNSEDPSAGFRCEPCDKSFRKLHHLVEHRETHDGINSKQKVSVTPQVKPEEDKADKSLTTHQCEVCKKSFRKLHHLIEHKDQHLETSSEKSDDKSVKSCLSTRDIIHECSLCYMVFPNEHSLTKHTVICQRKKRQSKQAKPANETGEEINTDTAEKVDVVEPIKDGVKEVENVKIDIVTEKPVPIKDQIQDVTKNKPENINKDEEVKKVETVCKEVEQIIQEKTHNVEIKTTTSKTENIIKVAEKHSSEKTQKEIPKQKIDVKPKNNEINKSENAQKETDTSNRKVSNKPTVDTPTQPTKRDFKEVKDTEISKTKLSEIPEKIKKINEPEIIEIEDTPKKKTPLKEKSAAKRVKAATSTNEKEVKPPAESSDDDEIRYMFNPNFKAETVTEEKVFMKVRANKRSSLQIERPNSKDLMKRRTSLQHPPKIPRHKPKPETNIVKNEPKMPKQEPVPSTDSDDSETTKYSFPTVVEKAKAIEKVPKESEPKTQKKSIAEKRKTLSGIAKRKSLGKAVTARHKPSPLKTGKKRTLEIEHRCDCGQLFSSAALLARHTTLSHTPPRIRRRRSPPPEEIPAKTAARKSITDKPKQSTVSRKSSVKNDTATSTKDSPKPVRKSVSKEKPATDKKSKLEDKSETKSSVKLRRSGAHKGVPVPEKMRKLMQKNKLSSL